MRERERLASAREKLYFRTGGCAERKAPVQKVTPVRSRCPLLITACEYFFRCTAHFSGISVSLRYTTQSAYDSRVPRNIACTLVKFLRERGVSSIDHQQRNSKRFACVSFDETPIHKMYTHAGFLYTSHDPPTCIRSRQTNIKARAENFP